MEAYTSFAKVYDTFMDNVPYEEWGTYVEQILQGYGINDGLVLELGCGTGSFTEIMAHKGYDMIGIDNAEDMLQTAMEKREQSGADILYLLQDMQEFELYGTVSAVVSICDSLNYICEEAELLQVFRLVNNYLDPSGLFVFDMNSVYKYEKILGERTIAENRELSSFIWDNYYDKTEQINEYELTIFAKEQDGLYRKYEETHFQKAYAAERIKMLLEKAGMQFIAVYDAYTLAAPQTESERLFFIARENGKATKK